jgi:hypothetical protein
MVPEDLLFWIAPLRDAPTPDPSVLCRRHADAMVVPRGWTLDDLRDDTPRLFRPRPVVGDGQSPARPKRARARRVHANEGPEQLQIDGTGEIERPIVDESTAPTDERVHQPWQPEFDAADDLDGLLEVNSPLLARAFRGTDRPKR